MNFKVVTAAAVGLLYVLGAIEAVPSQMGDLAARPIYTTAAPTMRHETEAAAAEPYNTEAAPAMPHKTEATEPAEATDSSPEATEMAAESAPPYLKLYEAGVLEESTGVFIKDGSVICPASYPKGITIVCKRIPAGTKWVKFEYDGEKLHTEMRRPYTIAGDIDGDAMPWESYGHGGVIRCVTNEGVSVETKVTFKCDESSPSAEEDASSPAVEEDASSPAVEEDASSPATDEDEPEAESKPKCDKHDVEGESDADDDDVHDTYDDADPVMMEEETKPMPGDGKPAHPKEDTAPSSTEEPEKPMTKAPMMEGESQSTKPPKENPTSPPMKNDPAPSTSGDGACVVINAKDGADKLPSGWVARGNGIVYKPGGGHKIDKEPTSDDAIINYCFKSPVDGRMGVAMDSTSGHRSEMNDIWIGMKEPQMRLFGKGPLISTGQLFKCFQDSAGRDERMWCRGDLHINGRKRNGDTVSTGNLERGRKYCIQVAGRSHNLILHNLVLWPCSGDTCLMSSREWRGYADKCRPF